MITLRQVEAFKSVMEAGTVLRAAEQMGLSQPAVSRLIGDLERRIGYPLFDRRKGRIVPRREASELYGEVERSFAGLASIADAAQRIGRGHRQQLRVAVLPAFNGHPMPRIVARFVEENPDVFLTLVSRSRPQMLDEIAAGQHDIAIATLPVEQPDIATRPIVKTEYQLLVPTGHPLSARDSITLSDLKEADLISSADPAPGQRIVDGALNGASPESNRRLEVTNGQLACALVAEQVGACLMLRFLATDPPNGARAISFSPKLPAEIVALHPSNRPPSAVAARFVASCAQALQAGND